MATAGLPAPHLYALNVSASSGRDARFAFRRALLGRDGTVRGMPAPGEPIYIDHLLRWQSASLRANAALAEKERDDGHGPSRRLFDAGRELQRDMEMLREIEAAALGGSRVVEIRMYAPVPEPWEVTLLPDPARLHVVSLTDGGSLGPSDVAIRDLVRPLAAAIRAAA